MNGRNLLKEYVDRVNSIPVQGRNQMPVVAQQNFKTPLTASEKWSMATGALTKRFAFRTTEQRNAFINELFLYEDEKEHHAALVVREDSVLVSLLTKPTNAVTELDKEYAKAADDLYKIVTFSSAQFPSLE